MKRLIFASKFLAALVFIFLLINLSSSIAAPPEGVGIFASDHILVKFKPGSNIANIHVANKTRTMSIIPRIGVHAVSVPPGLSVDGAIKRFKGNREVEYAEPDYIASVDAVPNDPEFSKQWGMNNTGQTGGTLDADIDSPEAWDVTTGSSEVTIAILDTGVKSDHPDLAGKVIDQKDCTESQLGVPNNSPTDVYGHGTHVAGIVAAATNNGKGVAGVGYNCSLMNVKVIDDNGYGWYLWIANGIIYAADNGAKVINMSLGGAMPSLAIEDAVNYAWNDKGVVVVASAGNTYDSIPHYPAYYSNCIAVAASDHNDVKADFSTYGTWVDVTGPGASIYSTILPIISKKKTTYYGYMSGTSMSAPHASGLAGLVWSKFPAYSNNEIRCQILATADPIPQTGNYWVWGRINAYRAVTESINVHDVAVANISSPSWCVPNDPVAISVGVQNQGTNPETFMVSLSESPGEFTVSSDAISLSPGASSTVSFLWDSASKLLGEHTLTATIDPVASESIDTFDNSKSRIITVVESASNVMHIGSVDVTLESRKAGKTIYVKGKATVKILDSSNNGVAGATISGRWVYSLTENDTGITDGTGTAILYSSELRNPKNGERFQFIVDNVTKEGWFLDAPTDPAADWERWVSPAPELIAKEQSSLENAYPNPCNPDVWIPFRLADSERVVITIYDITGQPLRRLDLGQLSPGNYSIKEKAAYWDGRNEAGESVASGIYFYTIQAGALKATKKMLMIR